MDDISSLLGSSKFKQPEEMVKLKQYIKQAYQEDVGIEVRDKDIIIMSSSSALANTLRLNQTDIKNACGINKKLVFRVS
ncbi:MAG TPA: hypothetical protein VL989_01670 [Candidatus Sulfotelmatobacter sp.]|nr:hypothetical protein [Candidatus Sulfotelmatobacter sp.]